MPKTCFVIFSTADWKTPYWTNKQHMALQFEGEGFDVLYIETPGIRSPHLTDRRDLKRIFARVLKGIFSPFWQVSDGITICSPLAWPWAKGNKLIVWANNAIVHILLRIHLKRKQINRFVVWTYHPFIPMLGDAYKIVYHCVDDLAAVPGVDAEQFNEKEYRLLQEVDCVFATSSALAEKCTKASNDVFELPNVVDFDHFSSAYMQSVEPDDVKNIPHPRIGYVGVLSDFKLDLDLVEEVVRKNPQWSWVFIGNEREGQSDARINRLIEATNVFFLGYKPYNQLPTYFAFLDVGTLPTLVNEYTHAMFPMKFYEYIASGLPVVSTPLDFTKNIRTGLVVADGVEKFALAIQSTIQAGKLSIEDAKQIVGKNTWTERTKNMLSIMRLSDQIRPVETKR